MGEGTEIHSKFFAALAAFCLTASLHAHSEKKECVELLIEEPARILQLQNEVSEATREKIAGLLANEERRVLFDRLNELNAEERFQLARSLATERALGEDIEELRLEQELQRAEIAVLQVEAGHDFLNFQEAYDLHSRQAWFPVILAHARTGQPDLGEDGRYYGFGFERQLELLSAEEKGQIVLAYSQATDAGGYVKWFTDFDRLFGDLPDLYRRKVTANVLGRMIQKRGWARTKLHAGMTARPSDRIPVAILVMKGLGQLRARQRAERDAFLFRWLDGNLWAMMEVSQAVEQDLFLKDAVGTVAVSAGVEDLEALTYEELGRVLRTFALSGHSEFVNEELVEKMLEVSSPRIVLFLFREYFAQHFYEREVQPRDGLELICQMTGIDAEVVRDSPFREDPSELFEVLTRIQKTLGKPAFEGIPIEPAAFEQRRLLIGFLERLGLELDLAGKGTAVWETILNRYELKPGITVRELNRLQPAP